MSPAPAITSLPWNPLWTLITHQVPAQCIGKSFFISQKEHCPQMSWTTCQTQFIFLDVFTVHRINIKQLQIIFADNSRKEYWMWIQFSLAKILQSVSSHLLLTCQVTLYPFSQDAWDISAPGSIMLLTQQGLGYISSYRKQQQSVVSYIGLIQNVDIFDMSSTECLNRQGIQN